MPATFVRSRSSWGKSSRASTRKTTDAMMLIAPTACSPMKNVASESTEGRRCYHGAARGKDRGLELVGHGARGGAGHDPGSHRDPHRPRGGAARDPDRPRDVDGVAAHGGGHLLRVTAG